MKPREPQPRAAWTKKYANWLKFTAECVWCGDNFVFFAPASGETHDSLRYCSRRCIVEARWEGQKKVPNPETLSKLYILQQMSIPSIAKELGCSNNVVWRALQQYGILVRKHTSVRSCKRCGAPVEKRFHHRRDKNGQKILCGTLCLKHRREYFANWVREKHHRVDPLIGTRKVGSKPIPTICPKCGKVWESRRAAVACHNQQWSKVKAANLKPPQTNETARAA